MEVDGLSFHEAVTSGRLRLPCATTPAEDEQGRPAPKRVRQKLPEPAKARWAADGRRFAPWHYVEEAMMHDAAGRLHIIPPAAKEKLHMLPPGYTAADFLDDRARQDAGQRLALGSGAPAAGHAGGADRGGPSAGGTGTGAQALHHAVDGRTVRRRAGADGTAATPAAGPGTPRRRPGLALAAGGSTGTLHSGASA